MEGLSAEAPVPNGLLRHTLGQVQALDGVDLRLRRGQTLAVVGEAGSGKTTLARVVAGLAAPSAGKVLVEGKDLAGLGKAELARAREQIQLVTAEALAAPGALAALLTGGAKLLVFDDAFEELDAATRLRLFLEIRGLQDDQALACLVLTRSLELAGALSDQIAMLYAGQIVESGTTASLLANPQHPYTQSLLTPHAASPVTSEPLSDAANVGCRFRARCSQALLRCAQEAPAFFAVPGGLSRCFLHDSDNLVD